jgi:predicted MFS family arabinose efflux permease
MADNAPKPAEVSPSKSALTVLFSVVFLDNLGFAIVLPYLFYYAQNLGASDFTYGLLLAAYSVMSFAFTPVIAWLSDRYGRRRILLVALAVSSFSYFVFGTAQMLWLLFASRMLAGTTAATVPVAQAYVADVTTEKNRLRYLGLLGAAAGLAFILGPAIGGTLSAYFGFAVPSFLASALALANLVSTYFRLPEPPRAIDEKQKSSSSLSALQAILRKKTVALLLAAYFMFFMSFVFLQAVLSPWLQKVFGFGSIETGYVFFYIGAISVFTQTVLLPRLSRKSSRSTIALIGIVALATGLFALSNVSNLILLFLVVALASFGFGIQIIALNTLISVNTPKEAQGGTLGVAQSLAALAQTIAPILAASAFTFGSSIGAVGLAFIVSALLSLSTLPLVLAFRRTSKE